MTHPKMLMNYAEEHTMNTNVFAFDPNRPPPMPPSALLYSRSFMYLVCRHAPAMLYGLARNARRDACQTAFWLRWAIYQWHASLLWLEMNAMFLAYRKDTAPSALR